MARHILLIVLTLIPLGVSAQNHVRRAMERARERQEAMARAQVASEQGKGSGGNMRMVVKDGDTTYLDRLPAVYILSRSKRTTDKQWRQYYKLVWRFARAYPYAHLIIFVWPYASCSLRWLSAYHRQQDWQREPAVGAQDSL